MVGYDLHYNINNMVFRYRTANESFFLFFNFFLLLSLREQCDLHSTEVRGIFFFILFPKISTFIVSKLILLFIGALFGPSMTIWYQFLNRLKFPSPTKALIYRVGIHFPFDLGKIHNIVFFWVHSFGLTKLSLHQVGFSCSSRSCGYSKKHFYSCCCLFL